MTEDQISEFREAFNLFDQDLDGKITLKELIIILRALRFNLSEEEIITNCKDYDPESNEQISFPLFLSIVAQHMSKETLDSEKELLEAFRIFDKDGSGFIPTIEFRHILTSLGEKLSNEEADAMIKDADPHNIGKIDYVDFIKIILS